MSSRLYDEIKSIKAIDNHTHIAMSLPNIPYDFKDHVSKITNYLTEKPQIPSVEEPLRNNEYNLLFKAIQELYGYTKNNLPKDKRQELISCILDSREQGYENAYSRALDIAGIDIALSNTYYLQEKLDRKRFKHVPWVDQYLYPVKVSNVQVFQMQHNLERWLDTAYQTYGKPETFDDYVALVHSELRRYIDEGAISVKIWSAFFRSLYFKDIEESVAKGIYSDYINDRRVDEARYKQLQDYLAHLIFSFCMENEVPVQVHTGFGDSTKALTLKESSPLNLENIAKAYDDLKLILIHGGYPFCREAGALAMMNGNVYLDYSYIGRLVSVPMLSCILGDWIGCKLEDRLLFGTDTVKKPWATDDLHCVYVAWKTRKSVEDSLVSLIDKKVLDLDEAIMVASKILRSNAVNLYGLGDM
jgi:hypothetical protein